MLAGAHPAAEKRSWLKTSAVPPLEGERTCIVKSLEMHISGKAQASDEPSQENCLFDNHRCGQREAAGPASDGEGIFRQDSL